MIFILTDAHQGVPDEAVSFLPKSFPVKMLTRKVREVLDGN